VHTNTGLIELDASIAEKEAKIQGIRTNNQAKIIWASEFFEKKTPIAFVYLHGFGASHREGEPVMKLLSEKYKAHVYMARLKEHGIDRSNSFEYLTPNNYINSAREALEIGRTLGDKIILVSTSTGGALSLILASEVKDILGLVLYSPFIDLKEPSQKMLIKPGGKEHFIRSVGSEVQKVDRPLEEAKYWSTNYHVNGYMALMQMVFSHMVPSTFAKVQCPVFLGYYYKNEKEQDNVVSVAAMHKMYQQLNTPQVLKKEVAFPKSGNHVIACDLRSKDWQGVFSETVIFIDEIIYKSK